MSGGAGFPAVVWCHLDHNPSEPGLLGPAQDASDGAFIERIRFAVSAHLPVGPPDSAWFSKRSGWPSPDIGWAAHVEQTALG